MFKIGQVVKTPVEDYGWVRHVDGNGDVTVEPLPDFVKPEGTPWVVWNPAELVPAKVCGCATLGYRDNDGRVWATGCDYSRTPKATFLPGHDARAKSFLIKAWGEGRMFGGFEHSLDAARSFSDKISLAVAKGIDNARKRDHKRINSRRWRSQVERPEHPAQREDTLTPAQRLQKQLKVTDPMLEALAHALVQNDGAVYGTPVGTIVAMQKRGLVEKGGRGVTRLGRQVMDYDLQPDKPVCDASDNGYADPGVYAEHFMKFDDEVGYRCVRCGHTDDNY